MKDLGVPAAAAEAANLADTGEFDCRVLNSGNFPSLSREEGELIPTGEVLGRALRVLGVERAYGVMGGGCARLISGIEGGGVQLIHMRHESSAAFSACEEYLARGTPAAIWTTTGPGFVNALNGVTAIGWEGAKALFLSGATGHDVRPGFGFQDTREHNLAALRHLAAPHAKLALSYPQTPSDVYELLDEWRSALTRPGAFIGAALVPLQLQQLSMKAWVPRPIDDAVSEIGFRSDAYERLARELESGTVLIWTGFGARGASAELRELVSRLDARVISSPRSKGTFPEDDPAYLGVTGHGGHERVLRYMQETGVDTMLILGTRLHELTSFRDRRFSPRRTVIHVDCDRSALTDDFLDLPCVAVRADVASFIARVIEFLPPRMKARVTTRIDSFVEQYPRGTGVGIHPCDLMAVIQREAVDGRDMPIMTDVGTGWAWGPHCLQFNSPRYRTSTTWGSMCHFAAGVVGTALATGKPALCITGDGSMLMQSEVSTAVSYRVPAKWVVINNAGYGTIRHGLAAISLPPMQVDFPMTRFDLWAESQGALGLRATTPSELATALRTAFAHPGPVVIDAVLDPSVAPPIAKRNASLMPLGASWRT